MPHNDLKWPRSGASCDGVTSDCSSIPYRIKEAEVTLAMKYTTDPGLFPAVVAVVVQRLAPTSAVRSWARSKLNTRSIRARQSPAAITADPKILLPSRS